MSDDNLELGGREEIGRGHAYFGKTQVRVISCLSLQNWCLGGSHSISFGRVVVMEPINVLRV